MTTDGIRPEWARQKQPDPPNFGEAKLVSERRLRWILRWRMSKCERILENARDYCEFEEGLVSFVVLSCKRLLEFRRLCETLVPYFHDVENYPKLEKILVDNGSGTELIGYAESLGFFDTIIAHETNLGMARALNDAYQRCRGEYIVLLEDDMVIDHDSPFIQSCLDVFDSHPEIGIIRLKNQNNWWKPFRVIAPLRTTPSGVEFWTWLPSRDRENNVWACGSVMFRKASFFSTGMLEAGSGRKQAYIVENEYAKKYNKTWLAAKIKGCYPSFQPNDNQESPGFQDTIPT